MSRVGLKTFLLEHRAITFLFLSAKLNNWAFFIKKNKKFFIWNCVGNSQLHFWVNEVITWRLLAIFVGRGFTWLVLGVGRASGGCSGGAADS